MRIWIHRPFASGIFVDFPNKYEEAARDFLKKFHEKHGVGDLIETEGGFCSNNIESFVKPDAFRPELDISPNGFILVTFDEAFDLGDRGEPVYGDTEGIWNKEIRDHAVDAVDAIPSQ